MSQQFTKIFEKQNLFRKQKIVNKLKNLIYTS